LQNDPLTIKNNETFTSNVTQIRPQSLEARLRVGESSQQHFIEWFAEFIGCL